MTSEQIGILASGVLAMLATAAIGLSLLASLKPQRLVGDEHEYLSPERNRPTAGHWVRVPLFRWILSPARGNAGTARRLLVWLNALFAGFAAAIAASLAGPVAGILSGLLLALCLERGLLSIHAWPDVVLGGLLVILAVLLIEPSIPHRWLLAGCAASLSLSIRIDSGILVPVAAGIAIWREPDWGAPLLAFLLPVVLTLLALSIFNGMRHGVWLPDTTLAFNLRVARNELAAPSDATVQDLMSATVRETRSGNRRQALPIASWRLAGRSMRAYVRRLQTFLGSETFCTQRLIENNPAQYRGGHVLAHAGLLRLNLRYGFSLLAAGFLALSGYLDPVLIVITGAVMLSSTLIQTRSRYRASLIPTLAVFLSVALVDAIAGAPANMTRAVCGALGSSLVMLLVFLPGARAEH